MSAARPPAPASFADLFTPKLITVLRGGYGLKQLQADALAGLTVAVVALPLSMAIAIASGVAPQQGLYTAIVGGFVVSLFGGSRFQIGGPAGAFIVLVAATVQTHGVDGLILATMMAGVILAAMGWLRLGSYIKFVPYPVTVGFTAGIAAIIALSQVRDSLGLTLAGAEPARMLEKFPVLWRALPTATPAAAIIAAATILVIVLCRRFNPRWPGMLIGIAFAAVAAAFLPLGVETLADRYGAIRASFPAPHLPPISIDRLQALLPSAASFALLGAIESLLSAVVADGMTGGRHRSNCELVAQGAANVASGLFGGFCVTGAIARTATNVRAGAHGPVAGMLHSVFLLAFLLIAAPLVGYIPLASLAGVLLTVAWNMAERHAFGSLLRASPGDAAVLLVTFGLTLFLGLTEAIVVGFGLGSLLFIHRMSALADAKSTGPFVADDQADSSRSLAEPRATSPADVTILRLRGALFFGASASIASVIDRTSGLSRALVIDFSGVPFIDATAAHMIKTMAESADRHQVLLQLTGTTAAMRRELFVHGVRPPLARFSGSIASALAKLEPAVTATARARAPRST